VSVAVAGGSKGVLDVTTVLGDLHDGIAQAAACLDAVVCGVGVVVARVAGTGSGPRTASTALRRDFAALTSRMRRVTATGGDPAALRAAAAVWATGLGQPAVAAMLDRLADAITAFWVDVTVACAALVRALFAAAVAATSALGAPTALDSAAAALATFGAVTGAAEQSLKGVATAVAARLDGGISAPTSRRPRRSPGR
jgi:hypothetical protein